MRIISVHKRVAACSEALQQREKQAMHPFRLH